MEQAVLAMLRHHNCGQNALLTRPALAAILDKQAAVTLHRKFTPSILDELWGQVETTSRGEATALTLAKVYSQAMAILQDRINVIDGPTGIMQQQAQLKAEQGRLKELETHYQKGYQQGYQQNNALRRNITAIQANIQQLKDSKAQFQRDLSQMQAVLEVEERPPVIERSEYMAQSKLDESFSPPEPSPHLSLIFKVVVVGILLQMGLMGFRLSFLALLSYFLILYWLFLGYFDQHFVKVLITGLAISCGMDFAFATLQVLGKSGAWRRIEGESAQVYVNAVALIIEVALRILLIIKLCLFREPSAKREYFILFGNEIQLNNRSGKMLSSQKSQQ